MSGPAPESMLSRSLSLYATEGLAGPAVKKVLSPDGLPTLFVRWIGPGFRFRVVEEARIPGGLRSGPPVVLPEGFTFDAASVPRLVWTIIAPVELGIVAPAVHDFLYRTGGDGGKWTRGEADGLFLDHMKAEGVGWLKRRAAWLAVRVGGRASWQEPTGSGAGSPAVVDRPAPKKRKKNAARVKARARKRRRGWS